MRVLVLGGGKQGRAAVHDLAHTAEVRGVTCADVDVRGLESFLATLGTSKVDATALDASDARALRKTLEWGFDVVIDLLPRQFVRPVGEAAVDTRTNLVNTYYDGDLLPLAQAIERAGITVLPEMGLDPGIDLVLCGEAVRKFDEVTTLRCYGAGFPEPSAADNPLRYKITWTWSGVLNSYDRPARLLRDGREVNIPASDIFDERNIHLAEVPGVGPLEAFPNGDAVRYAEKFGIRSTVRDCVRYTLRWPGHAKTWNLFTKLGFLEETPVPGLPGGVTPRLFMTRHLEPRLQYRADERDVAVVLVACEGLRRGRYERLVLSLVDYRDLATGLMAMNRTVGFAASIAAQMIVSGRIRGKGLLSPASDVPYADFAAELAKRGMTVQASWTPPS